MEGPFHRRLLALAALAWCAPALGVVGDPAGPYFVGGSLRVVPALVYPPPVVLPSWLTPEQRAQLAAGLPESAAGASQTLVRLTAVGAPLERLKYEAHVLQVVTSSSGAGEALGLGQPASASASGRYRAVEGSWRWEDSPTLQSRLEVDRLSVKLALPVADVTLGRQAITFGKAYFWNPCDLFLGFGPFQFDRDYKSGVDALRVDVPFSALTGLTLVGVAGRDPTGRSWYGSAVLGRLFATVGEWDVALQGGKTYGGFHLGGGVEGEAGPIALRGEAAWFTPDAGSRPAGAIALPEAVTLVGGAGHRFENGLTLDVEYLFNGAGRLPFAESWPLVLAGEIPHASRHVVGAMASFEPTALLKTSLSWLVSLSDGSTVLQPGLTYSAADEVDVVAGAVVALGPRPRIETGSSGLPAVKYRSEFGSYPNVLYVEVKTYF
jgi:hypothetical protein